jgi:hypothetical protein
MMSCGERLLLVLWGRRAVVREPGQENVRVPDPSGPFRIAATERALVERRQRQREARAYVLARLRDLITRAGEE